MKKSKLKKFLQEEMNNGESVTILYCDERLYSDVIRKTLFGAIQIYFEDDQRYMGVGDFDSWVEIYGKPSDLRIFREENKRIVEVFPK